MKVKFDPVPSKKMKSDLSPFDLVLNIIGNVPHDIFWKDKKGVFLGCNPSFAKAAGLTPEEIVGKTDFDMPWKDQAEKYIKDDCEVIESGQPKIGIEDIQRQASGKEIIALVSKVPLRDKNNKIIGILGIYSDITERKRQEEEVKKAKEKAEAANKAKSEFLSIISHEIRIPLNSITTLSEVLNKTELNAKQKEYVDLINKASHSITPLLQQVTDFMDFESGMLEFITEEIAIKKIIEGMVENIAGFVYKKGIDLLIEYKNNVPDIVLTDSARVYQALDSLLNNAIRFTRTGSIKIILESTPVNSSQVNLKVSVEDTGVGISEESQQYLFSLFDEDAGSEHHYKYAGLRLSIIKEFIEKMGGSIAVKSNLGQGSTFSFVLPCKLPSDAVRLDSSGAEWEKYKDKIRILIVDDNPIQSNLLQHAISGSKVQLNTSENAKAMLKKAAESGHPYQIVIIDQKLNRLNALPLAKEIKVDPKLNNPLTLMLIYPNTEKEITNTLAAYSIFYFIKPILPTQFTYSLAKTWENYSLYMPKILLIEDDPVNQLGERLLLESLGCQVTVAATGQQALNLINNSYDIVFLDINLPDKNGVEIVKKIKSSKSLKDIPIVALTGYAFETDKESFLAVGMCDVVLKPATSKNLEKILDSLVPRYYCQGTKNLWNITTV